MERETRKQSKTLRWWTKVFYSHFEFEKQYFCYFLCVTNLKTLRWKAGVQWLWELLIQAIKKKKEYRTFSFQIGSVQGRQGRIICWVSPSQEHDSKKTFSRKNWNANPRKPLTIDNPPKLKTKWCKHLKTDAQWKAAANFTPAVHNLFVDFGLLWSSYCIQF